MTAARGDFARPDPDKAQGYFEVSYDTGTGEMTSAYKTLGDTVTDIITVRANLQEKVLRQACIYELEKLGYTIISPENGDTDDTEEAPLS